MLLLQSGCVHLKLILTKGEPFFWDVNVTLALSMKLGSSLIIMSC